MRNFIPVMAVLFTVFVIVVIYIVVKTIVETVKNRLNSTFEGADAILRDIEKNKEAPKSVCGMTSIYLPMIQKDFPHFNWAEMRARAETTLINYLSAIDSFDEKKVSDESEDVRQTVRSIINQNKSLGYVCFYRDIRINDTAIFIYKKSARTATIGIEVSIGFHYKREKDGNIVDGTFERLTQKKYRILLTYSQNINSTDNCVSIKCPNCGAAIESYGDKVCEYCGTPVTEINSNIWKVTYIKESLPQKI